MFKNNTSPNNPKQMEPNSSDKTNRIVAGTRIEGEIHSDSNIRIDGSLNGNIRTSGKVVIGGTGKIKGEVICEHAEIEGSLFGKIQVNGLLSLKTTARVEGDIVTSKLAIEPGAVFSGSCDMGAKIKEMSKQEDASDKSSRSERKERTA